MINVTKSFLPPLDDYIAILKQVWDSGQLTNDGPVIKELETELKNYLSVNNLLVCSNGTIALQLAIKALNLTGDVITTPFSYVATTNAILWENCNPIFCDINPDDFCIDYTRIEAAITSKTTAILATHVFGQPCDVQAIHEIANRHQLKVIYDGAHAFGTRYQGRSIFSYGDVSTCSFHATKLFHTGEGGCVVASSSQINEKLTLLRAFGHLADHYYTLGINGKNSELHAALGLTNLKYIDEINRQQKDRWLFYSNALKNSGLVTLQIKPEVVYNYAYFPVLFPNEMALKATLQVLNSNQIFPRRYFHPSLNTLPFVNFQACPVAESVAVRIFCLPLYFDLTRANQEHIVELLLKN